MAGTMQFSDMRSELVGMLENQDAADFTTNRVNRWLNWAYAHVAMPRIFRHSELQSSQTVTLVADDRDYALNADVAAVYSVTDSTQSLKLRPRDIRDFDERSSTNGTPYQYAIWDGELVIWPNPTSGAGAGNSVVVRYWQRPTVLSSDSDVTVIAPEWDEVIVLGGVWRAWRYLGDKPKADIAKEDFSQMVNEISDRLRVEAEDTGGRMTFDLGPSVMEHAST